MESELQTAVIVHIFILKILETIPLNKCILDAWNEYMIEYSRN